jgi:PAS domain S-box-containing protein
MLGYKPEEVTGRNVLGYIHTQDQAIVIAALTPGVPAEVIGALVEVRVRHQDGLWRWFEVNGFELKTIPLINGTVVNCRDITDRKNVESLLQAAKDNLEQQVIERTAELQSASARLKELVLHSPAVIYSTALDGEWKSVQASDNVNKLLGYTADQIRSEIGFWNYHIHPEDAPRVRAHKGQIELEKRISCKYRLLHRDGNYRWIRDDMQLVLAEDGRPLELIGSWIDITNQVEAERSTLSSQDRYRGLYESMMDAFVRVDMSGKIMEFNQAYINMLGYLPEELYRLTYIDVTPPKWHAMEAEIVNKQIIPLGFSDVYEKEYIRKDGSIFSIDLRTSLTRDGNGNPESMWAIVRDISHRKQSEASLLNAKQELEKRVAERTSELVASQERLRSLTREIITTQEDERRSVSRELHDEAGQVFVTLKHSLDITLGEIPADHPALKARLASAMQIADASMQLMRDLSHRLRPPALEVGGINISLEDLCLDIAEQTNLRIHYQGEDLPGLPNEIAISLYRVMQESLTNILKHAGARNVQVRLRYLKNKILLSVRDDGKGVLDTNPEGTGLLGLQERLRLLGGDIKVEAHPGKGVHLKASVPWQKEAGNGI